MKEKINGITLVALSVTIILILIVSGITISLTIGDKGIISTAKQAGKNYMEAAENEQIDLANFWNQTEDILYTSDTDDNTNNVTIDITNATADRILKGYTAYVQGNLITGTMEDISGKTVRSGAIVVDNSNVYFSIPSTGYYDTNSKVSVTIDDLDKALSKADTNTTATADKIIQGYTAYVNGNKITGTLANRSSYTTATSLGVSNNILYVRIPQGAYVTNSSIGYPEIKVPFENLADVLDITPEKIVKGYTIAGVTGTYSGDSERAEGAKSALQSIKNVGLPFTATARGVVVVNCSVTVVNHDNSGEAYIYAWIYKNGSIVAQGRDYVSEWGGGSASCSATITVEAGDTISVGGPGSDASDTSIFCNLTASAVYGSY
jgi:hypothetical protein